MNPVHPFNRNFPKQSMRQKRAMASSRLKAWRPRRPVRHEYNARFQVNHSDPADTEARLRAADGLRAAGDGAGTESLRALRIESFPEPRTRLGFGARQNRYGRTRRGAGGLWNAFRRHARAWFDRMRVRYRSCAQRAWQRHHAFQ